MPTVTTRTRKTRGAGRAAPRKPKEVDTSSSEREPVGTTPAKAGTRSSHRGSRSARTARRSVVKAATVESPAKTRSPVAPPAKKKRSVAQSNGTTPGTSAPKKKTVRASSAKPSKSATTKAAPRPAARPRKRKPSSALAPRARIPVTGAPSDEVPAPFAHNAEYEFARILDFYGIDWQYEPKTFPLKQEGDRIVEAFTPDFYLPDRDLYVELTTVKANLTAEKNRKMRLLKELHPDVNVMLLKKRDYLRLLANYGYGPLKPNQVPEVDKVLITANKLERRVGELGAEISRDYADRQPLMVGVLRGVLCFIADLMRHVSVPVSVDLMAISSYQGNGAGAVRILKDLDENIKGRDVILVEDIVDTGMTLNHVIEYLRTKRPASIRVCTLLDKRARRLIDVPLDYVGFEIPDAFVVGYGLDFRQQFRHLPFIATLKHELLP